MQIIETKFEARAPGECSVTDDRLEDLIAATDTWVGREIFIVHKLRGLNKLTHTNCFDGWTRMMDVHANGKSLTLQGIGERWEVAGVPCKDIGDEIAFIEANPQVAIEEIRSYKPAGSKPVDSAAWTGRGFKPLTGREPLTVFGILDALADLLKAVKACEALGRGILGFSIPSTKVIENEMRKLRVPGGTSVSTADLDQRDKMAGMQSKPMTDRESVLQHLTDVAVKLDALRYHGFAEDVRHIRNEIRRGTKDGRDKPSESRKNEWSYTFSFGTPKEFTLLGLTKEHVEKLDGVFKAHKDEIAICEAVARHRALVEAHDMVARMVNILPTREARAILTELFVMAGVTYGAATKLAPEQAWPAKFPETKQGHFRATGTFEPGKQGPQEQAVDWIEVPVKAMQIRDAAFEEGRKAGLQQAILDIVNYPTAFAQGIKKSLVDLIHERIRGER